jgi:hypothetical protein
MKSILCGLAFCLAVATAGYCVSPIAKTNADVTVSSTAATLITGISVARRYALFTNTGSVDIRLSTFPQVSTGYGIPVGANLGHYADDYYVLTSSWYAISCGTNTAGRVNYFGKE